MTYTVTQVITNALYTAGIVARDFQTVTGSQTNDGLTLLNEVITDKTVEFGMIPYFTTYTFNAVAGQEVYFIPNLEEIETLVFYIDHVRYQMSPIPRKQFFGSSRADTIESLPFTWHYERCFGGSNIYLYFLPDTAYPMRLWGIFRLAKVQLGQDLELTLDDFYINYLKYALAEKFCAYYNYDVPANVAKQLEQYKGWINKRTQILDLRNSKISTLSESTTLNYAQINLGKGWSI